MVNDRMRQMMQEALDEVLPDELRQELDRFLDTDSEGVQEYNKLRRVDNLLKNATFERAPKRLAATIMARLAENIEMEQQVRTQGQHLSEAELELSREMIGIALTLVTVATMPLLVAASWMVVNSLADPSLLTAVLQQMIGFMLLVLEMLQVFLEKAEGLAESDPQSAMALLALIPMTLLALVRYMLSDDPHA
jgi:anti-sigma factor RsiW